MTPRFVFRPAAIDELREARDWYEAQRTSLGAELGHVIATTVERIAAQPDAFPEVMPSVRRVVLERFPYGIFYRQQPDVIEVLAVFYHRRDPRFELRVAPYNEAVE